MTVLTRGIMKRRLTGDVHPLINNEVYDEYDDNVDDSRYSLYFNKPAFVSLL